MQKFEEPQSGHPCTVISRSPSQLRYKWLHCSAEATPALGLSQSISLRFTQ